jgi:hypothetical protein
MPDLSGATRTPQPSASKPPFYRRWWFLLLAGLVLLSLLGRCLGGDTEPAARSTPTPATVTVTVTVTPPAPPPAPAPTTGTTTETVTETATQTATATATVTETVTPPPVSAPDPDPDPPSVPDVAEQPSVAPYPNCDAVRAAGADPISAGEPGWSPDLDRDGDGVACE